MKSIFLYNQDGSLCSEAQLLLSNKPDDMSRTEWRKRFKEFKALLTAEDVKEFETLKRNSNLANWKAENSEKVTEYKSNYYYKNKEKIKNQTAKWRAENKEASWKHTEKWHSKNPDAAYKYSKRYHMKRGDRDPLFRFYKNLRVHCSRVVKQLALGKKPANTFTWVGCTAEELKTRFESLFTEGMTWENYGEWHVDHIRPVSSFAPEEWALINHYTNLQPLWAKDNLLKGDSWEQ